MLWNGAAVGKQLGVGEAKQPLEVVGVAGQIRAREIRDSGTPMIYVPSHVYEIEQTLVVKTFGHVNDQTLDRIRTILRDLTALRS